MRRLDKLLFGAGLALAATGTATSANAAEIVIGMQCDRTGPTQTVGTFLCPGYHDYVNLVNSRGGIEGHTIRVMEIDHEYKVPAGVEAYALHKKEGAVLISLYGTPHTQALTQKLTEDKTPGTSPGFGTAAAANGENFPYIFPIAASYWSQAAAGLEYVRTQVGGDLKGKKIAYIYYDNPAGREPLPVLHKLRDRLGYELREFAVPPPGIEMSAQVLDITRRYRADFVLAHLFGRAPSVSMKEFKRAGYPLEKVLGFVWGGGEADIAAAGGFDRVEGYSAMQFAGVGSDYPVLDEIREMYKAQGKDAPKEMESTVYYNRGVFAAAIHLKAIENAVKAKDSGDITGEDVKNGMEQIKGFTLGGLVPPMEINGFDHEGGGWVRIFQVQGSKFVPTTDWFQGYRDTVVELLKADASRQ
ncbi:MAG: ABC transporter substrate-binding protein [Alphaproteobacteria bacterium]|nr:ABC transporter substrate-binding protein [Alphaproteobacteria bacterium]